MTMNPEQQYRLAVQHIAETRRQAELARAARSRSPRRQLRIIETVRIRLAFLLVQVGLHLLARSSRTSASARTTGAVGTHEQLRSVPTDRTTRAEGDRCAW
jgi:hypothetical protein